MPKPVNDNAVPKTEEDALALVQALIATPRLRKILRAAVLGDKVVAG